jgi:hypothetical protein
VDAREQQVRELAGQRFALAAGALRLPLVGASRSFSVQRLLSSCGGRLFSRS